MAQTTITEGARRLALERFKSVEEVHVSDSLDQDGEPALELTLVVKEGFDPQDFSPSKKAEYVRELLAMLQERGDHRFPYIHLATQRDLADLAAAND